MAHFMAGCRGNRKAATRLGGKYSFPSAFVNGWNAGVRIVGVCRDGYDEFDVFATGGSNSIHAETLVGTIVIGKNGLPKLKKAGGK